MCTLYPVKEGNWELCFPANFFYWKLLGSQHLLLKSSLLLTPVTKSCCVQTSITIVVLQLIKKKKKEKICVLYVWKSPTLLLAEFFKETGTVFVHGIAHAGIYGIPNCVGWEGKKNPGLLFMLNAL